MNASVKNFAPVQAWLPPLGLSTCIRAVLSRSSLGLNLATADRLAHFPVSPTCSINCLLTGDADLLASGHHDLDDAPRQNISGFTVTGPQTKPRTVFYETPAHGIMVIFYPDAWHALTGSTVMSLTDQVLSPEAVLPADLLQACRRMWEPGDDNERVQRWFDDLLPIWQRRTQGARHRPWSAKGWAASTGPWVESLSLRAAASGWGRSLRQSERRIKQWTGWSLRRLHGFTRGETVFFAAMAALLDDQLDWTQVALEHGFADQSHFIREVRRLTGFTPETLKVGILQQEAYWSYRAWAALAGYPLPLMQ